MSVTHPRSPRGAASVTAPLGELTLSEKESVFHIPRAGDVALLGVLIAVLLGNGIWLWRQLGSDSHAGRAIFFGMMLLCAYWCGVVYTFKLSLSVRVSPRSISVVRGPLRVEIRWADLSRLMERIQTLDGRRYRWVIAVASDGRRISVREDAIGDYARFRREAYERYRLYRDHGGTWGATGTGPFVAKETMRDEAQWWSIAALMLTLPGLYFMFLLPETNPLGYILVGGAALCLLLLLRAFFQRQTYRVDRAAIESRRLLSRTKLPWGSVSKVERVRHPVSGLLLTVVAAGRMLLRIVSRADMGIRNFTWAPRVPEYLILRGGGRQTRVRLHRLMQPDELLAWIEFYDQVRRARATSGPRVSGAPATTPVSPQMSATAAAAASESDLSDGEGPLDPWGNGRQGEPVAPTESAPAAPFTSSAPTARRLTDFAAPANGGFTRATSGARPSDNDLNTFDHADMPTVRTPAAEQVDQDDAWLRETGAQPNVGGRMSTPAPAPVDHGNQGDYGNHGERPASPWDAYIMDHLAATPTPAAPEPWSTPPPAASSAPEPEHGYRTGGWRDLSLPTELESQPFVATPAYQPPEQPAEAPRQRWADAWRNEPQEPRAQWQPREPVVPERPAEPTPAPAPAEPGYTYAEPFDTGLGTGLGEEPDAYEEDQPTTEVEAAPTPWREEGWQPPALPRFGPQRDEPRE